MLLKPISEDKKSNKTANNPFLKKLYSQMAEKEKRRMKHNIHSTISKELQARAVVASEDIEKENFGIY